MKKNRKKGYIDETPLTAVGDGSGIDLSPSDDRGMLFTKMRRRRRSAKNEYAESHDTLFSKIREARRKTIKDMHE